MQTHILYRSNVRCFQKHTLTEKPQRDASTKNPSWLTLMLIPANDVLDGRSWETIAQLNSG